MSLVDSESSAPSIERSSNTSSTSACPFSVEMIADENDDGSANSVHLAIPESSSMKSLRQEEEEDEETGPELVRVDSSENSASSTDDKEGEKPEMATRVSSSSSREVVKKSQEDAGMIDCLSDQFSNMFCPAGESHLCISKKENRMVSCEVPCQAFDPSDPSTDVFSHLQFWWTPSQEEKLQLKKSPKNRSMRKKHRHVKSLMDNWHPKHSEPLVRSKSILDAGHQQQVVPQSPTMDTACYDSDPEEVYKNEERRESMHFGGFKDRKPSPLNTSLGDDRLMSGGHPRAPTNATRKNFHFASTDRSPLTPSHLDLMSPENDEYIREFVQEVTNSRLNLIWHRYNEPEGDCLSDGLRAPMAVSATFEVGTHLDHKVVQPKLTWNASNSNQSPAKKSQLDSNWVELLSIIRVITPNKLNRKLYPFARTDRTLCIVANDNRNPYLVFEAESQEQRDWLVTALKMTVARLASIIIIKDESMLLEFFSPYAALISLREQEEADEEESVEEDVDLVNGDLNLMEMSPVLFNPKDL
ncbi:unnamed protein product [Cylindrotheca closterium]|uniref:Uncharacterized protein n=1 Tax=Cylindrotheca closterium TaxID=2856 RepID=A0AAD2FJR3_9STRA|nr:unnamed protein product [Cylindrotheca closterium]